MSDIEVIAKFMGIEVHPYTHWSGEKMLLIPNANGILDWPSINRYCPEQDWNQLMPVITKIDELYTKAFPPDFVDRILAHEDSGIDNHYMEVIAVPLSTPIEKVVPLVVEFIKWHSSQQGYKGDTHSQEE